MDPLDVDWLQGLKHFKRLAPLLCSLHEAGTLRDSAGNRRLFFDDYAKLVLLYLWVSISPGSKEPSDHVLRLVEVAAEVHPKRSRKGTIPSSGKVLLVTDLLEEPAELVALIYRYRWTIELFFRMLKQLLGCRHLLSQRPAGIDIQIYCAVIAAMVIHLQTGKKPNKAMVFVLGLYLAGWADEQEVLAQLNRPDRTGVKLRAKEELWKKLGY